MNKLSFIGALCLFFTPFIHAVENPVLPKMSKVAFTEAYSLQDFSHLTDMKGFSKEAILMHLTLYKGYVKNTNFLLNQLKSYGVQGKDKSYAYRALKRRFNWEFNGMRLHEYYFENLGCKGKIDPESALYKQIVRDFGSYAKWKNDFVNTGLMRGIGWVILYYDLEGDRLMNLWVQGHNIGNLTAAAPILVMDVWEHAYITQFGLSRRSYITAFFDNLRFLICDTRLRKAKMGFLYKAELDRKYE